MADNRTFTLVGKFDDQITKKLKSLNKQLEALGKFGKRSYDPFKGMSKGIHAANKELDVLQGGLKKLNKHEFKFNKSGIPAAQKEVQVLGKQIDSVAKKGFHFDKSGIQAAQQEARVLGDILKANALIKVGEGVGNALAAGAQNAVNILGQGMGFVGKQFRAAVQDQMEDLQARGSLYGSLKKQGLFKGKTAEEQTSDYRQTKVISRANEQAIGQLIRTSSVSTSTVTTLNRQLTDNLLPSLLKAKGITDLSGKSREDLDKVFGGKEGVGTDLARLYEQMATILPSPQYAKQGAMGFTQALTSGTINRQLSVFENNPVLVDALKTIDGGIQGTADIGKRIQILRKALEVAAPTMMLDEMKNTIAGGMQAVQDTIMNPTVGILSLGADIANEGKKTLQQYKDSGAYQLQMERTKIRIRKSADKMELTGLKRKEYIAKQEKEAAAKLADALESADSPIEKISVALAPVLQSFAGLLNTFGNLFIGPVTSIMNSLYLPLSQLQQTFDFLATDVDLFMKTGGKEGRSIGEALGRAFAEFFKALAKYFNPEKAGKEIGGGITRFFDDFMKGFNSAEAQGSKWMKMVLDTLGDIIMRMLFKEGDVLKGTTPLGDGLAKVFLLLSAPAFVNALIVGLVPLAIQGMGSMMLKVLASQKLASAVAAGIGAFPLPGKKPPVIPTVTPSQRLAGMLPAAIPASAAPVGGGAGAAGLAAFMTNPVTIAIAAAAALAVIAKITEPVVNKIAPKLQDQAAAATKQAGTYGQQSVSSFKKGDVSTGLGNIGGMFAEFLKGEFVNAGNDFMLGFNRVFSGLADLVVGLFSDPKKVTEGINKIFEGFWRLFTGIGHLLIGLLVSVPALFVGITNAVKNLGLGIAGAIKQAWDNRPSWLFNWDKKPEGASTKPTPPPAPSSSRRNTPGATGQAFGPPPAPSSSRRNTPGATGQAFGPPPAPSSSRRNTPGATGQAFGPPGVSFGSLGAAAAYEMKHKPSGSNLVIANSSEMVIPAAGGLGVGSLVETMRTGFAQVAYVVNASHASQKAAIDKVVQKLASNQQKTDSAMMRQAALQQQQIARLTSLEKKVGAMGMVGAGLGGASPSGGGVDAFTPVAQRFGLQMTSAYRPGDPGWHGANRARDFSNGSGPTPQMMQFASAMASTYGRNLKELIYTPLGFSVKNGQKVAPYAQSSHNNHVHVAYGLGGGAPTFFNSASAAQQWEKRMAPRNSAIASVTSNSSEFGGGATINAPITINAGAGQDSQSIADAVVTELEQRVARVRSSALFFNT